jgi:hypothetical protein
MTLELTSLCVSDILESESAFIFPKFYLYRLMSVSNFLIETIFYSISMFAFFNFSYKLSKLFFND